MLEQYTVSQNATVREAIEQMDKTGKRAVLVVDNNRQLRGLFTNGDMRKYILTNGDLSASIQEGMNRNPIVFYSLHSVKEEMDRRSLAVYPVVSKENILIDVIFNDEQKDLDFISDGLADVPLVIMAGGKGTRLYPYTQILPKALIPIGELTISERIIHQFNRYGCKEVHFVLNHKGNMIKSYYNELVRTYKVNYVEETKFLGTGGGLSLLKGKLDRTFIVSNCDTLIQDDLECAFKTHKKNSNKITFICAMKNIVIPYGIISTDTDGNITEMTEKPKLSFLTNTGVYIIEPEVINNLNDDEFIHLPDIAKKCIERGDNVGVFPVSEKSWLDMGQFSEMKEMMKVFEK